MKTDFLRSYEEVRFILHLLNYEHISKNSVIKFGLPQIHTADRFVCLYYCYFFSDFSAFSLLTQKPVRAVTAKPLKFSFAPIPVGLGREISVSAEQLGSTAKYPRWAAAFAQLPP